MNNSAIYTSAETAAPALADWLGQGKTSHHVLLITHVNPDGDAIGSLTGLGLALEVLGHQVTLLTPSPPPRFVANMPVVDRIQTFAADPRLDPRIDRVVLVDTGDMQRIGGVWEEAHEFLRERPIAVIDHHVTNSGEGAINYVDATRSSTCELIYELLDAWQLALSPAIATALLLGVTTDTQSFRTSNTTPSALRTAARLLEAGADRGRILRDVYHNTQVGTARLLGLALGALRHDDVVVWTHVTREMLAAAGADEDAPSEVTDYLSSLGGFRVSLLLKELKDGAVKISLRSIPGVDVSTVAREFGGGGHRQAAGATLRVPLDHAEALVLQALHAVLAEPMRERA